MEMDEFSLVHNLPRSATADQIDQLAISLLNRTATEDDAMKQRILEGPLYKLPMHYRRFRGMEWEVCDADDIVWALTWSERSAEAIADAINARAHQRAATSNSPRSTP